MKEHLLQIGPFPAFLQTMIDESFQCHSPAELDDEPGLAEQLRGIITRSNQRVSEDVVRALPNLGIIATCGVGYDQIPVALAHERGIKVTNTPDVLNSAVAELTVGMVLALLRRIPQADQFVRSGRWATGGFPLAQSLAGKHIGIVGLGRIGKEVARRLLPFDVRIAYHGRTDQHLDYRYQPDLHTLARDSDLLIVAAPGSPSTRHLINAEVLRNLGPEGYLVNIARGVLVDEDALLQALTTRTIGGAALDVYQNEPNIDTRFLDLDNTVLLPHIGSATHQTRLAMGELTLNNLRSFFRDGSVLTAVRA